MAATYCGKDCTECVHKEPMNCAGCKTGPGRTYGGDCELAKCVRAKGHETCSSCTLKGQCGNLRTCQYFPEYRRRKQEAETQRQAALADRAMFLGKWLWILFWLVVPTAILGIVSNDTVAQVLPTLDRVGPLLNIVSTMVYGLLLLKLGAKEDCYRTAGICTLVSAGLVAAMAGVSAVSDSLGWQLLLMLPAVIMELVSEYQEYIAHSIVLEELDGALSEKWTVLSKWFIGLYLGMFGSIALMLLSAVLGALAMLGATVGLLVLAVLKMIYLYRTAKCFREYTPDYP